MMVAINKAGFIELNQIHDFLDFPNNEIRLNSISDKDDTVILFTHKGAVQARTVGQKKYLKSS